MTDSVLWAYGVIEGSRSAPKGVTGLDGRPVMAVRHADLAVLASPVPAEQYSADALQQRLNDLETLGQIARAHDAVLEAALIEGDVVPFRICTLYTTVEAIKEMLAAEVDRFARALAQLRGMTELGVKAFARRSAGPPTEEVSSGTEYLARRLAERKREADGDEAVAQAAAEVHERLADATAAAVLLRPQDRRLSGRDADMVLNGAYLVARDELEEFGRSVEALSRGYDLELELTGPWPPYHFAEVPA